MPVIKVPESAVLRACTDLLTAERIWWMRANSGALRDGTGRPVRFGRKGMADILCTPQEHHPFAINGTGHRQFNISTCAGNCCPDPMIVWVECKGTGGKWSDDQAAFREEVTAHGHRYLLVHSMEELKRWLIEHGAMRSK